MSWWSRFANSLRPRRFDREIDEELQSHLAEAIDRGRDSAEARRAFGSPLRLREASRDVRILPWLDSLRADLVFGWRQLTKHKVASASAILSLGLATGACIAAFRLVDAMLLRPLPVAEPARLYAMFARGYDPGGHLRLGESNEYPQFAAMRAAVKDHAELIAVSYGERIELTFGSAQEIEKAHRQFVSGWMFDAFGLRPALGRLFTENDDLTPRAHPFAVLSYDYWTRRFHRDPSVLGRSFRMDDTLYQIVGVAPRGFTGTEPGTVTDLFLPTMMYAGVTHDDWGWIRTFVRMHPGASVDTVRDRLQSVFHAIQTERAKGFVGWPARKLENFLSQTILVLPAAGGLSFMREQYSRPLHVLAALVGMVLLIACANVANLLTGQAAARAREMALRISIGAGRRRLVQLLLVESALLALLANLLGVLFAWWAAPYVVDRINPSSDPARLVLPADWRVLGFAAALTIAVTFLFGLLPALRSSSAQPVAALKGGDPHARRRWMHGLIAMQVAFCCVVLFVAGLLVASFEHMVNQPTGFSAERLLALDIEARPAQPAYVWNRVAQQLQAVSGVERVSLAGWALLSGVGSNGFVSVNGASAGDRLAYFLKVSPGWLETMRIPLLDGRDLRPGDTYPGAAIVNQAFAKEYFGDANPVGRWFARGQTRLEIVGLVRDARYRNLREPITPTAYVPFGPAGSDDVAHATLLVRTLPLNPLTLAAALRAEVPRAHAGFHVGNLRTQQEINRSQSVRERLLAALAIFFAVIALLLAAVGLYGVLDYSVLQRRREIGIRMAIGAPPRRVAAMVVAGVFAMVLCGALAGSLLGLAAAGYLDALLYDVRATDPRILAAAAATLLATAAVAALAPIARALRTDPIRVLRVD